MDQQRIGFFSQSRHHFSALRPDPIEFFLCARPQFARLLPLPSCLREFVLEGLPVRLDVAEHAVDGHDLGPEQVACPLDNLRIESQALRDRQGVAAPRHADHQTVRRPQGLDIELHRRVLDTGLRVGQRFQFVVMRRHGGAGAEPVQALDQRSRQRHTLGRIGTGADLVEKDEGPRSRRQLLEDSNNGSHVR